MGRGGGAKDPIRLLASVREELERGWSAGLTVLTGDDLYHLDAAQEALRTALTGGDDSGLGLTVFGGEKVETATVVAAARSRGMFAERRVVLVTDVGLLDGEPKAIAEYAGAPPPESFLIVRAPVLDQRRKLHKVLGKAGRLLHFAAVEAAESGRLGQQVTRMARERGLKLSRSAALLLVELTAGDLYRVASELDKMAAWVGTEEATIDEDVVREVAAGGGLMSGWEVADAVLRRDTAGGLAAARRLVERGEEPIKLLGGLAWRARVMLQAKVMFAAGRRPDEVARSIRGAHFLRDRLARDLTGYRVDELLGFPAKLLRADRTLKSRSIRPGAVLEQLVTDLTRPGTAARKVEG